MCKKFYASVFVVMVGTVTRVANSFCLASKSVIGYNFGLIYFLGSTYYANNGKCKWVLLMFALDRLAAF